MAKAIDPNLLKINQLRQDIAALPEVASVEYIDHVRTTRSEDGVDPTEQRLLSATMGSGAELKRRAWDSILSMSQA